MHTRKMCKENKHFENLEVNAADYKFSNPV